MSYVVGLFLFQDFRPWSMVTIFLRNSLLSNSTFLLKPVHTMPAKSLGTLAMIYATDELQHPLPHYTMLSEADMNNPTGEVIPVHIAMHLRYLLNIV